MDSMKIPYHQHLRFALTVSHRRRVWVRNAAVTAALITLFGLAGSIDYAVAKSAEREAAEEAQAKAQREIARAFALLTECIKGELRLIGENIAIRCEKAIEVTK
jgi:hypothetical protein